MMLTKKQLVNLFFLSQITVGQIDMLISLIQPFIQFNSNQIQINLKQQVNKMCRCTKNDCIISICMLDIVCSGKSHIARALTRTSCWLMVGGTKSLFRFFHLGACVLNRPSVCSVVKSFHLVVWFSPSLPLLSCATAKVKHLHSVSEQPLSINLSHREMELFFLTSLNSEPVIDTVQLLMLTTTICRFLDIFV